MASNLGVSSDDGLVIVSINRPAKRNALTLEMLGRMAHIFSQIDVEATRCVILCSEGGTFSAGVDLNEIGRGERDTEVDEALLEVSSSIRSCPIPVIAAIEGACMGGAVEIALACDIRVAGQGAKFAVPAVRLGVLYRPDGIAQVMSVVGRTTAFRLMVLGEQFDSVAAHQAGLISHLTSDGEAFAVATGLWLGLRTSPPMAVRSTKSVINAVTVGEQLDRFEDVRRELLNSDRRMTALNSARTQRRPTEG